MATLPEHHVEIQTCCNGAMCQGRCVLFSYATAPECFCAGQTGGCPGPMVCCEYDVVCGVGQCCTGRLSCQTDHGL